MKQWTSALVIVVVFGTLVAGGLGTVLAADTAPEIDNRPLTPWPGFRPSQILDDNHYQSISTYLDEHLIGRALGVEIDATIDYRLLRDSANPNVTVGRDGWLFYSDSLTFAQGGSSAEEVAAGLDEFNRILENSGRTLIVTIAPNKAYVYPEYLPARLQPLATAAADHTDELRTELRRYDWFIDIHQLIMDHKDEQQLYYSNDTHWMDVGGALWIEAVVEHLAPGLWSPEDLISNGPRSHIGDLARQLGIDLSVEADSYRVTRAGVDVTQHAVPADGPEWLVTTSEGEAAMAAERVIVIHDSFVRALRPQTAPYFRQILFANFNSADPQAFTQGIIDSDVVILEVVERNAYDRFQRYLTRPEALDRLAAALEQSD